MNSPHGATVVAIAADVITTTSMTEVVMTVAVRTSVTVAANASGGCCAKSRFVCSAAIQYLVCWMITRV